MIVRVDIQRATVTEEKFEVEIPDHIQELGEDEIFEYAETCATVRYQPLSNTELRPVVSEVVRHNAEVTKAEAIG